MIPKIIWQTYKTEYPPLISSNHVRSWIDRNVDYEWMYFDDNSCDEFMKDHFSSDYYDMYASLPIGVMKADMWRVAIIYIYGGFYADLDTTCNQSLDQWVNDEDLLLSVETAQGSICNYFFGAKPKHPALLKALETFKECYQSENYLNKQYVTSTPVQNFGAHAFSSGILKYYDIISPEEMSRGGTSDFYNTLDKVKEENTRFLLYNDHQVAPWPDERTLVSHSTASMFWKSDYDSWREEQRKEFGV